MEFKDRLKKIIDEKGIATYRIGQDTSLSKQSVQTYIDGTVIPNSSSISILAEYLGTTIDYLLEGKEQSNIVSEPKATYSTGRPYYDVDFIGGFDIVLNDTTLNPEYLIDLEPYNKEGILWVNLYGKSMEPYIMAGDKIAIREILTEDAIFGKPYGIITTTGLRTVKWVVRSPNEDCYRLIPENKDPKFGDYQDILKKDIFKVFIVMGSIRAL